MDYSGNQIENDIDFIYVPVLLIPESIQIKKYTAWSKNLNIENS